jgi:hypothetical protein
MQVKPMQVEAASSGFYEPKDFPGRYPRLQVLTIAELLEGKKIQFPEHRVETFAKAERKTRHEQEELFCANMGSPVSTYPSSCFVCITRHHM